MKTIFEISRKGVKGYSLPSCEVKIDIEKALPQKFLRKSPLRLPEVSEPEIVRHFTRLSEMNFHIDHGFYPLGSCTMKYNPKIAEELARLDGFLNIHPLAPEECIQGALQLIYGLQSLLQEISGFDEVSLQPAAGAHGELTSLLIIKQYFKKKGEVRTKILIPDSAHGTNPASCVIAGFEACEIPSDKEGNCDVDALKRHLDDKVAGIMLTVPNTLGLFEKNIKEITKHVHDVGGLVFMDGANFNAFLGIMRPAQLGIDLMHFNLHKTFSTPHGGGGPGGGAIGVKAFLREFLPVPRVVKNGEKYRLDWNLPNSVGKVHTFYGNFNVMLKAYAYIRLMGAKGLLEVSRNAIINANYIRKSLEDVFELPYKRICMHECVFSGEPLKKYGVRTLDIAKRLLDYDIHPPTIYFPLIVHEALMIEPTETESKATLDEFISAMKKIKEEAKTQPEILKSAPTKTPVRRLDEARASRELDVNYFSSK